jgi:hypothetical protein
MRTIAKLNVLIREGIELLDDLGLVTEEFQEGWNVVRSGNMRWLDRKMRKSGGHFTWVDEGSLRSGVGETSQEAIAGALKLALRRVSSHFVAAEIEHVGLKQYPWFFLARVRVFPYQIQQSAVLAVPDEAVPYQCFLHGSGCQQPQFYSILPITMSYLAQTLFRMVAILLSAPSCRVKFDRRNRH